MLAEFKELWRFRELLFSMVQRDLKIRYKNSFLGFFWSLLNPLLTTFVLTIVFQVLLGIEVRNYSAYILAAYLPFTFFQMSIMDSAQSVLTNLQLIKKIYFPREILPLAAILSNFVHFLLALGVFFVFLLAIYIRDPRVIPFQWTTIYLPILLLINFMLAAGIALIVSALNTFYEDVKYIVGMLLWMLFFLSPVMYFVENVYLAAVKRGDDLLLYHVYNLNPVAVLCTAYRKILLAPPQEIVLGQESIPPLPMDWGQVAYAGVVSFVILVAGYHVFNRMKWRFVERP